MGRWVMFWVPNPVLWSWVESLMGLAYWYKHPKPRLSSSFGLLKMWSGLWSVEDDHHSCLFCSSLATAYGPIHTQFQLNVVVPGQPNVAHGILKRRRFKFHMLYAMVYVVSFSVCIFVLGFFLLDTIQTTSFYDPIFTCLTFYIFFFGLLLLIITSSVS